MTIQSTRDTHLSDVVRQTALLDHLEPTEVVRLAGLSRGLRIAVGPDRLEQAIAAIEAKRRARALQRLGKGDAAHNTCHLRAPYGSHGAQVSPSGRFIAATVEQDVVAFDIQQPAAPIFRKALSQAPRLAWSPTQDLLLCDDAHLLRIMVPPGAQTNTPLLDGLTVLGGAFSNTHRGGFVSSRGSPAWQPDGVHLGGFSSDAFTVWDLKCVQGQQLWRRDPVRDGAMRRQIPSPSGTRTVLVAEKGITLLDAIDGTVLGACQPHKEPTSVSWLSDEQHIALGYARWTELHAVRADMPSLRRIDQVGPRAWPTVVVSPNLRHWAVNKSNNGTLQIGDVATDDSRELQVRRGRATGMPPTCFDNLKWSKSGRYLAFTDWKTRGVCIVDAESHASVTLSLARFDAWAWSPQDDYFAAITSSDLDSRVFLEMYHPPLERLWRKPVQREPARELTWRPDGLALCYSTAPQEASESSHVGVWDFSRE